ncbi:heparan-alpha-glucosaminide N-acetyltransferase domain-containing protein [Rhodococcus gannanensis]|uniref:Heparan-alpha-glucosaminide N-acetyltransferase domain-containing protein n=1 Tax=Rhodococcus gannanensis TaxID=1960308 RepID=A0ABW4P5J9_9NOCA
MSVTADPAPTKRPMRSRLTGIDLARGLAVVGMVAVHSLYAYGDDGLPTLSYRISAGHASAMFAVLAGVSIALLSGRARQRPDARSAGIATGLVARAIVIGVIGLSLGYTDVDYGVVILPYYAVMFVLAIPLIFLGTRTVAALAAAGAVAAPVVSQLVRPHLGAGFDHQLSWGTLLHDPLATVGEILFTGEFPVLVWMTYICVGVVVGRCELRSPRTAGILVAAGAVLTTVSSVISWTILHPMGGLNLLVEVSGVETVDEILRFGADGWVPTDSWWWLGVATPHTGTPLDLAATVGSSLAVLGLCLLVFHVRGGAGRVLRVVTSPLVAIGTLSLTVYVGHIMFVNSDFDVYGPWDGYIRQLVVMAVVAVAWRATAGRGPLEGLVRSITTRVRRHTEAFVTERRDESVRHPVRSA